MKLILDSSVVTKLFVNEKLSEKSHEILETCIEKDIQLISSDLVMFELGNSISKHIMKSRKKGKDYINNFFMLDIEYIFLNPDIASLAMEIAQKNNITYYDAVHISISKKLKGRLVTEDKELLKKFKNTLNIDKAMKLIENHS